MKTKKIIKMYIFLFNKLNYLPLLSLVVVDVDCLDLIKNPIANRIQQVHTTAQKIARINVVKDIVGSEDYDYKKNLIIIIFFLKK